MLLCHELIWKGTTGISILQSETGRAWLRKIQLTNVLPSQESEGNSSDPVFESLRKRGHRITAQRETILQIFREQAHGNHLSAEELHAKLAREALMLAWLQPIARSSFSRR